MGTQGTGSAIIQQVPITSCLCLGHQCFTLLVPLMQGRAKCQLAMLDFWAPGMSQQQLPQEPGLSLSSQEFHDHAEAKSLVGFGFLWLECRVGLWDCPALPAACGGGGQEGAEQGSVRQPS